MKHFGRVRMAMAAAVLTVTLGACGGGMGKQSTGDRLDDGVITAKVKTTLLNDPDVKGTAVNVETFKGVVQLSGFVRSEAERTRAAQLARGVSGVTEVRNDLQLRQ